MQIIKNIRKGESMYKWEQMGCETEDQELTKFKESKQWKESESTKRVCDGHSREQ